MATSQLSEEATVEHPFRNILLELLFGSDFYRNSACPQRMTVEDARLTAGTVFGLTEYEFDVALADPYIQDVLSSRAALNL